MAEKRMFTQKIIDSDAFLDMPLSTQALYFHLNMRADDDGFVNNPKKVVRMVGACDDDLKLLIVKRFVIGFDSGVIVIKHWRMHNTLRKDRYNPTHYQEELSTLAIKDNNSYTENRGNQLATNWQPDGNHLATQYSIEESSIEEKRVVESSVSRTRETSNALFLRLLPDYDLSDPVQQAVGEWLQYKTERRMTYKETGLKSLLKQVENSCAIYGDAAVCDLISECMANGWTGIIWDRLKKRRHTGDYRRSDTGFQSGNPFLEMLQEEMG